MDNKLVQVRNCPWCKSDLRESNDVFSNKINHYITTAMGTTSESAEEVIRKMKGYQCLLCKTTYLDPWFHPDTIEYFFNNQKSVHRVGWGKFRDLVTKGFSTPEAQKSVEILRLLQPEFMGVRRYIEVGCPFMGILGFLSFQESDEIVGKKYLKTKKEFFASNYYSRKFVRLSILNNKMENLFYLILMYLNRLQFRLRNFRPIPKPSEILDSADIHLHKSIELIVTAPETNLMWNENCVSETGTCVSTSVTTFGIRKMKWEELCDSTDARETTLVAFFNTLDHQVSGADKIEEALKFAKYVLLETHTNHKVEKQHSFVIDDTIKSLDPTRYKVRDLTFESKKLQSLSKDHYYLISLV